MTTKSINIPNNALAMAVDETVALEFNKHAPWPIEIVRRSGDALRRIHHALPSLVLFCVNRPHVERSAEVVAAIRDRRPDLPRLAIASSHDDAIERVMRMAGASHYFAIALDADGAAFRATLEMIAFEAVGSTNHGAPPGLHSVERPPPRSRASPAKSIPSRHSF